MGSISPTEAGPGGPTDELASSFADVARALYSAHTVKQTLERIVTFSVGTIEGCSGAGISFLHDDTVTTPVWTEPMVLEIDSMQYTTGEGPCLDAIANGESVYAEDLEIDPRWPTFGPMAAESGMRSLLSFCLYGETTLGALNLYAPAPQAFDAYDRATGLIFATHAGVALAAARQIEDTSEALAIETERLENLYGALASRQVIGRAEGILMQRELITADQAFQLLRKASQNLNVKLRDIAQYVVDTGDVPQPPADED